MFTDSVAGITKAGFGAAPLLGVFTVAIHNLKRDTFRRLQHFDNLLGGVGLKLNDLSATMNSQLSGFEVDANVGDQACGYGSQRPGDLKKCVTCAAVTKGLEFTNPRLDTVT